ncbi:MAG: hypothetical protein QGH25_03240 [Candidatus Latescibacteria bacterium]|nr:hypothetical protein [Candidatus Latescibacterota bacterium]
MDISLSGEVQTQRIRKNTNAVNDIVSYLRFNPPASLGGKEKDEIVLADAIRAGSNAADVVNVLDGDLTTYWQPAAPEGDSDLSSQWWFVIDLGRVVFAKRLVVRFVEEGAGDPFLLFEVLVSDGLKPARLQGGETPAYSTVLRTLNKNKSERVFSVDLTRLGLGGETVAGEVPPGEEVKVEKGSGQVRAAPVRFVQFVVTGTDGAFGTEVAQAEYDALDANTRGAVQYLKRQPDGREVSVDQDVYELLEEQRRGSIRYFRREIPRLADIEIWNEGDELISGILSRGGVISTNAKQPLALTKFVDGNLETFNRIFYGVSTAVAEPELELVFDLGSFFWIDTYRLLYNGGQFPSYRMDFSDGSLAPDGSLQWTTKAVLGSRPSARFEGESFDPIKARYGRFQWTLNAIGARTADPAEMQFYGKGFQPEVSLTSDLIRLGGSRNLQSITWDADTPPGTQVLIQTRTGAELGEILHYFKNDGTEVTEDEYGKLLSLFRGDIVAEQVPGSDWSDFSEPYENPQGSPIASPSPREFLEVKATLLSDDPIVSPTLRSIRLNFADPVAQSVAGEIAPFQVEELGVKQPFSLYVRPDFATRDPGFDELLLVAPGNMELDLVSLYGGRETDFAGEVVDLASLALENVEVVPTGRDSLHLRFDEIRPRGAVQVVRLDFETSLFVTGAVLQASLRNSGEGDAWQRVDPGEALGDVLSNTTTLVASVSNTALLTDVLISPQVFSPNGDGINDATMFSFNVVRVGDDSPVVATIFDLSGRRLRTIAEQRAFSTGEYQMGWDGRDGEGRIVPPGVYMLRLSLDTDTEGARVGARQIFRSLTVVY